MTIAPVGWLCGLERWEVLPGVFVRRYQQVAWKFDDIDADLTAICSQGGRHVCLLNRFAATEFRTRRPAAAFWSTGQSCGLLSFVVWKVVLHMGIHTSVI
eukprot:scaffold41368_cov16-Prasinocladus_malaysianus.AAC.1